jgi:hypothetical protein
LSEKFKKRDDNHRRRWPGALYRLFFITRAALSLVLCSPGGSDDSSWRSGLDRQLSLLRSIMEEEIAVGLGDAIYAYPGLGHGFSLKEMPIHTNWATHEQYREVGLWLKKHNSGEPVRVGREIGTLAFYCDCALLNHFSDRRWLKNYINQRSTDGSIRAALLKINFIFCKDDSDFPPISSVLVEHANRDMLDNPQFIKWETSTKWIPDGLLTYSEGDFNLNQKLRLVNPTGHPYVYTYIWNNGQAETYLLDDTSRRGRTYDVAWTVTPQKILFQGTFQAKQSSLTLSPGPYLAVAVAFSDSPARVTQHIFERRFWFTFTEDGQIKVFFPPEEWHSPRWPDESGWQMEDIDSVMTDR